MHLANQASRRTPMPGFLHQNSGSGTLLPPTQDTEHLLQVLLRALDKDTGKSSAHGAVYQRILRYLNKRKRFANWGESNKEIAAKLLDQQLFDRADSETDYENLNTLESRLGDLINFHDPTALSSETRPNNKATSAGPLKNAIASTTDYANVARNILSPSFLNPISPSFDNGLSALQRHLPNEHHQTHHNERGFSNEATVTSLNQYIDCRDNQVFQNNYDKWRPSMSQLPSCGNSNDLCGRLAFNTNEVQAIDGVVTLEGCMDSNLYGDMHLVPDCQFSAPGVSNRPVSSFGSRSASKSMDPSSVHFNSMINCTEVHPRLYQQTEQRSPKVAKVQVPLIDTQAASSEQGYLSQPRQLKSECRPSLPPYKQLDRLQEQPVLLDNGASLLPSSVSILNGSLKIEGCFVPDPRILEPHTILDAVQEPQTSLDGSPASSNVAVACGSGETRGEKLVDMARAILRAYLHVKTCSRQEECKEPRCMNMKQYFSHILCCNDRQHFAQRCFNIKKLVYHFNACSKHTCKVCSPVRMMGRNFSQLAVTSNMSLSSADASSIDTIDCLQPPSKRMKEDPSPFNSSQSENSQLLTLIVDQTQSPQELPHVFTVMSTSVSTRTESMKLDADPSASSSKESHANSYEAKVEDSEAAVKVQLGIEPGHSEEILTQCEQGKKHVQSEPDRLKLKAECTISASSAGHVKGTKLGKPKIKGLSLIESFTPEKVREHIRSLRQLDDDDPKNAETERGRGTELLFDNNTCSLCGMDKLLFQTHHRYCGSCSKQISPKGIFYSIEGAYSKANGGHKQISFCCKCYNTSSDSIKAGGEEISKTNLVKRWDYAETDAETEWWVQCDKCEAWQHQICALFNGKRNEDVQSEYTCPRCFLQEIENGVRKPLPQSTMLAAKNLPITMLSEHIEQWLFMRLKEERQQRANNLRKNFDEVPGAEGLVVRVVLSVDQKLEVKQHFHEIFKEEDYPAEFPYKSKAILLFQNIEGADVCLFGMFVQEFGSECALPNQRRVCISYIDSVKYFRPEIKAATGEALRSFVYHEILIGYLDYCKKRGFTSCYIWSCPSLKRDDYILFCHPRTQKMPKSDKLREWYQTVIRKAAKENIVVEHTNLYDHFFKSHSDCMVKVTATRLPYFESDYWSGEAETILKKEDGNMPQKKGSKTAIDRVLRAAKRDSLNGNPKDIFLMHQLGEIIRPMKEDFIMVHLQHICKCCDQFIVSGNRWVCSVRKNFHLCDTCHSMEQNSVKKDAHTANAREKYSYFKVEVESIRPNTNDGDKVLQNEYFDTRLVFLNLCESNHYQFDTLRRAKHSTMMILYHLHNPTTSVFMSSCIVCHNDIDTAQGWYCKTCPDYDLCDVCYQREGIVRHHHDLVNRATVGGCNLMPYKGIQKRSDMQILLDALVHASKCATPGCTFRYCRNLKTLFHHGLECQIRAAGRCKSCVKIWLILHMHARGCKESECLVPRCKDLRDHMQAELIESDARRRAGVRKRIRHNES